MSFDPKTIPWPLDTPEIIAYSRDEWGQPLHGDQALFELLSLEIFQAGLSWQLILKRRAHMKQVFLDFDIAKVAQMTPAKAAKILQDPQMIRNKLKVNATIHNAQVITAMAAQGQSFDAFVWGFVGGQPVLARPKSATEIPTASHLSELMTKAFKKQGFKFIGPTIMYSYIQGAGLVDNHLVL